MSQLAFQSPFNPHSFSPCSFACLFSLFAADAETHRNYSEFSNCFPGCLGCFLGYSLSVEFYSNSIWWLGGRWQQVLVVTDRMALHDFAVSIVQVFPQATGFSYWCPLKFPRLARPTITGNPLCPWQKTTEMWSLGRRTLARFSYVFWSEPCNT